MASPNLGFSFAGLVHRGFQGGVDSWEKLAATMKKNICSIENHVIFKEFHFLPRYNIDSNIATVGDLLVILEAFHRTVSWNDPVG